MYILLLCTELFLSSIAHPKRGMTSVSTMGITEDLRVMRCSHSIHSNLAGIIMAALHPRTNTAKSAGLAMADFVS